MSPDRHDYSAAFVHEADALSQAMAGDLHAPVPACPGWTVADVVGHLGRVHRLVALMLERRATEVVPFSETPRPPEGAALRDYFADGARALATAFAATDLDTPVWNWAGTGTAAFYFRRMTHETALHRHDVEQAYGSAGPFDSEMAADGVHEYLDVVLPVALSRFGEALPEGSLHLHRSDGAGEWMLQSLDGGLSVTHEHGKGTAAVRGPAGELLAFVWNRGIGPNLQVFGDEAVARAWAALAR